MLLNVHPCLHSWTQEAVFSVFFQVLTNLLFLQVPLLDSYPSHASPLPPKVWQFLEMVLKVQNQRLSDTVWWTGTRDGSVIHRALDKDGFPQNVRGTQSSSDCCS